MILTVDQLKAHLRIQHNDEDEFLESLLEQAQGAAEDFCLTGFDELAPPAVRLAVTLMASHYYENRDVSDRLAYRAMRMSFENLLWPHRDVTKLV